MRKLEGIGNLTSKLQEDILKHISITADADYKSISKETDKDRITILQSLQPLLRGHYISKQKLVPYYKKSKLSFKPTHKGILYALAYLDAKFDEIIDSHKEASKISIYTEFISSLARSTHRNELAKHFVKFFAEQIVFNDKGEFQKMDMSDSESVRIIISQAFLDGIPISQENIELLKGVCSIQQIKEIKDSLTKLKSNLESSISSFNAR